MRRKFCSHANSLSTFHLRLYRRNGRLSSPWKYLGFNITKLLPTKYLDQKVDNGWFYTAVPFMRWLLVRWGSNSVGPAIIGWKGCFCSGSPCEIEWVIMRKVRSTARQLHFRRKEEIGIQYTWNKDWAGWLDILKAKDRIRWVYFDISSISRIIFKRESQPCIIESKN